MQFAKRMDRFGAGIFSKLLEIKNEKLEQGGQGGVGAHPVILPVSADHTAVQSDIHCLLCRNHLDLCTVKICLGNTVFLVQQL